MTSARDDIVNKSSKPTKKRTSKDSRPSVKTSKNTPPKTVARIPSAVKTHKKDPLKEDRHLFLTRRNLLFGAAGIGVIAAGGLGVKVVSDSISNNSNDNSTLNVDSANIVKSDDMTEFETSSAFELQEEISLPTGSLAWANNSVYIAALIPTNKSKPLCSAELININSGKRYEILDSAIGKTSGYEIFDIRANDYAVIWTEANVLSGDWSLYASDINLDGNLNPTLIDAGTGDFDVPRIDVTDNMAVWLVMPKATDKNKNIESIVKAVNFKSINKINKEEYVKNNYNEDKEEYRTHVLFSSPGRMATPIYTCNNKIVITPRVSGKNVTYQLVCLEEDGEITDKITLSQSIKPLEAGWGKTGFHFSLDSIYNYGGATSALGTYTPLKYPTDNSSDKYNNCKWLNFSRNPSAPPCWCNNMFIVRSTSSICAVNTNNNTYCILERPNGSDVYGDYLVSTGDVSKIVSIAAIDDTNVSGDTTQETLLRIWKPAS